MRPSILSPHFRPGRQFALTWSIPDAFGGMTGALMHRSRAFVRLADRPVDILTLDDRLDGPDLEARLRDAGELVDGMSLCNIWDWLRENETGTGEIAHAHEPLPPGQSEVREHRRSGAVLLRQQEAEGGQGIVATDRFRSDGTLLVTDRRDPESGKRSVVLYDPAGAPARSWGSVWGIYRHWLDHIIDGQESFLIVDSKTAARFARTYRRRNVVTMHVLHGSHRTADGSGLSRSRRDVLEHLSDFDSVIVLTESQREDLLSDLGPQQNVTVIPNGFDAPRPAPEQGAPVRVRGSGLMLASLIARKRVSHAIKAVARAGASAQVTLDLYGEGERRPLLEKTIRSLEVGERVRLRGHDPGARSAFATADFMLLTSSAEGLPLALVEGMAAGCIPIAYDIPYGPSDVIADGRNGFLVAAGDIDALAARIIELQRMSPRDVEAMRTRAQTTAERFQDRAVTRSWAREMEKAFERKHAASDPGSALRRSRRAAGRLKRRIARLTGGYDRSDG